MVYVDEITEYPSVAGHTHWCHMTADTLEELHEMATKLGLKRGWFQGKNVPHYDLTPGKRRMALNLGAKFVPAKEQSMKRKGYKNENSSS